MDYKLDTFTDDIRVLDGDTVYLISPDSIFSGTTSDLELEDDDALIYNTMVYND